MIPSPAAIALFAGTALAEIPAPPQTEGVGIVERVGATVPLDAPFVDHDGRAVRLGEVVGDRPTVLVLAYYRCPKLCGLVLQGVAGALADVGAPGSAYRAVTVSFDPSDRPEDAARTRASVLAIAGPADWPFLTGDPAAIEALTASLGVTVRRDDATGEYAHPAAAYVIAPDGTVSRYVYGTRPDPAALGAAIADAASGRRGESLGEWVLTCFRYDPASRANGWRVVALLRGGGVALFAAMGALLGGLWLRGRA